MSTDKRIAKVGQSQHDTARGVLAVIFIVALIGSSLWILRPFLGAMVWAATIVVATWPLMISLQVWLWNKRALAVTVMTLLLLCVLVVPLTFAIATIVSNVDEVVAWAKSLATFKLPAPPEWIADLPLVGPRVLELWERVAASGIQEVIARAAPYAGIFIGWFLAQVGHVGLLLVQLLLTIILAAVMYANGELVALRVVRFGQRLGGAGGENAVWLAGQTIRGVALGIVVTALAQTLIGGLGLAIAQIGVVPVLGCAMAWLYWTGESGWGTFMLVWTIIVGGMDNFLRPILIRKGADLPLLLIFAGVVGGILAFGLIGIFIGPVVLAVADKLLTAWMDRDQMDVQNEEWHEPAGE
jgi:predicted PurR-regulated permease PerM